MGEKEDKEKAEKLAAAKKRVAQLQKKKKAAASATVGASKGKSDDNSKEETPKSPTKQENIATEVEDEDQDSTVAAASVNITENDDEAVFNDAVKAATANDTATANSEDAAAVVRSPDSESPPNGTEQSESLASPKLRHSGRQPSLSLQSKIRSSSFRDNGTPISPALGSMSRVEELERENKRLAKDAEDHENRWRKVEEELEELREGRAEESSKNFESHGSGREEVERLRSEIDQLRRQQQRHSSAGAGGRGSRRQSMVGAAGSDDSGEALLRKEIENKDSTIADMQLEISRLRSQVTQKMQGCETHGEQITALQSSLSTAENKLRSIEGELGDTKKALSRASEKSMLDGTERTSKDTKIRTLEREMQEAVQKRDEIVKKAEQLEKKVEAMNKLHREAEARNATKLSSAEANVREVPGLRAKVEKLESENSRLREKHKRVMSGDGGDEGLDELEDEERKKLERRIRDLEAQVFDLQRGVWRDKRVQLQPRGDDNGSRTSLDVVGEDFDEVDLTGSGHANSQRRSLINPNNSLQPRRSGFTQVLNSGIAAFRGSPDSQVRSSQQQPNRPRNDSLLQEFDDDYAEDDGGFDENAFAHAQREEEARKMVEHVREVKKGLKQWAGWRLDLVDTRRAGGGGIGVGEVFEV